MWLLIVFVAGFGLGVVVGVVLVPRRPAPPTTAKKTVGTNPDLSFDDLLAALTRAADAYLAGVRPPSFPKGTDDDDESQTHPDL